MAQAPTSEDCLYLNVWRPAKRDAARLPVVVWVHGGAFVEGASSVPIYDGAALARKGVIVVSINYRIGALGFLAHPALTAESGSSGNYGLMDIVASLRWVKTNVGAFGGDPNRVTLAGQSAGSIAVHSLMASPAASGLFTRAIAQSGSGLGPHGSIIPLSSLAAAEENGRRFSALTAGATIDDLRKLPTAELLRATAALPPTGHVKFGPVIDGKFLPEPSSTHAPVNDVAVLTGLNADENSGFGHYNNQTSADLSARIAGFGRLSRDVERIYVAGRSQVPGTISKQIMLDSGTAATALWATYHDRVSKKPTYLYLWRHVEPGRDSAAYGAFHSSEIPYVFQNLGTAPERGFGKQDFGLSVSTASYWANFIKSGDPNGVGLARWPVFNPSKPQIMELSSQPKAASVLDAEKMTLFSEHVDAGGWLGIL